MAKRTPPPLVTVDVTDPFPHAPGKLTISFTAETVPGHAVEGTVSEKTARELRQKLSDVLDLFDKGAS